MVQMIVRQLKTSDGKLIFYAIQFINGEKTIAVGQTAWEAIKQWFYWHGEHL